MKKISLLLVIFMLIFGTFALAAEEVKVPFKAIKSSCYGKIDMTKSAFALSEVGKECVTKSWLKANLSEEETKKAEEKAQPVSYEIVTAQPMSVNYGGVQAERIGYNVVVDTEMSKEQVRPTVERIISEIQERDSGVDLIHLYLYSNKKRIKKSYMPYDIAMADWAPGGKVANLTERIAENDTRKDYEVKIKVRDNVEKYLQEKGDKEELKKVGERSMLHNLAIINSSGSVEEEDVTINRFDYLLENIASKTKNTRQEVGDMSAKSVQILAEEHGINVKILDFMESANDAIPSSAPKQKFAEVCASLIVLMK